MPLVHQHIQIHALPQRGNAELDACCVVAPTVWQADDAWYYGVAYLDLSSHSHGQHVALGTQPLRDDAQLQQDLLFEWLRWRRRQYRSAVARLIAK